MYGLLIAGIVGLLLQYQRSEAAESWAKSFFPFRPSNRLVSESENSLLESLPSSVTASLQYPELPSLLIHDVPHDLTMGDLSDACDESRQRSPPERNDIGTPGNDIESREVSAPATPSDPPRSRIFALHQAAKVHGMTFAAAFVYLLLVVMLGYRIADPMSSSPQDVFVWRTITVAILMGIPAGPIGIVKHRTLWQIISNVALIIVYVFTLICIFKSLAHTRDESVLVPFFVFLMLLPLYLVTMFF